VRVVLDAVSVLLVPLLVSSAHSVWDVWTWHGLLCPYVEVRVGVVLELVGMRAAV
jgi:hypothetical protein